MEPTAFVIPSLTYFTEGVTTVVNFVIAVSSDSLLVVNVDAPVGQMGTLGPAISSFPSIAVSKVDLKAGFELWSGSVDIGTSPTGPISIAVLDEQGNEVDILFV